MGNYTFLIDKYSDKKTFFYAVDSEKFQPIPLSETYNSEGNLVGTSDAYDHLVLMSEKAIELFKPLISESQSMTLSIGDHISTMDHDIDFYEALKETGGILKEGVDYEINQTIYKGFNHFNGRQNISILIDDEGYSDTVIVIQDVVILTMLNTALENMKHYLTEGLVKIYYSGQIEIKEYTDSNKFYRYQIGFRDFDAENFEKIEKASDGLEGFKFEE